MDLKATRLRDAKLGAAIDNALTNLPYHYILTIVVDRMSEGVEVQLQDRAGTRWTFVDSRKALGDTIADAVQVAVTDEDRMIREKGV